MTDSVQILQTPAFKKAVKKLHANQRADLMQAIKDLIANPLLGERKKGDLHYLRVYKFKMAKQLALLGYSYDEQVWVLELLALGSHENFYRELKQ